MTSGNGPGTNNFQPYYQGFVTGSDTNLQGYFDYRIKNIQEAVVSAKSSDSGKTWTFQSKVLDFDSPALADDAAAPSDAGRTRAPPSTVDAMHRGASSACLGVTL